jgi:hypothetical protein
MRTFAAVVAVLALVAAPALAGDGNVPRGTLSSMGLSGLKTMSDAQGLKVRGMGARATVNGQSYAIMWDPDFPGSFAEAFSDYFADGFGPSEAGAAGMSTSTATLLQLNTATFSVGAQTASTATAYGF